jgi:hypothetical protein
MDDDQLRRMLEWAARARANPRFDLEERDYRLEIADSVRDILDAVARDEPIAEHVEALYSLVRPRLPEVVLPRQMAPLLEWAAEDERGLAAALSVFNDAETGLEERVGRFVEAFRDRDTGHDPTFGLVLGSLFNFATAPGRVPIVRSPVFDGLETMLGEPPPPQPPAERYAHHLAFAERMHDVFLRGGVPVRDMLDTDALILICREDRDFWTSDDDGRRPRKRSPEYYLAACAIYRDEAPYLAEWVEFHRMVGFEQLYLYNNLSSDDHLEVLEPYIEEGLVVLQDWPHFPAQIEAYDHCLATHGEHARWIGFFDIDEFVFSPTLRAVPQVLAEYEQWPGVCVNLPRFGTSGHRTKPEGLLIETYVTRLEAPASKTVTSIVDPAAVDHCRNAHMFGYNRRTAVTENGYPVHSTVTKSASFERLRANHYYSKSEEELRAKHQRRTADYAWERQPLPDAATLAQREAERGVRDETILPYAERLREALADRARVR